MSDSKIIKIFCSRIAWMRALVAWFGGLSDSLLPLVFKETTNLLEANTSLELTLRMRVPQDMDSGSSSLLSLAQLPLSFQDPSLKELTSITTFSSPP